MSNKQNYLIAEGVTRTTSTGAGFVHVLAESKQFFVRSSVDDRWFQREQF